MSEGEGVTERLRLQEARGSGAGRVSGGPPCSSCEIVTSLATRGDTGIPMATSLEYVDDEVVVLRPKEPEHGRVIVLPCRHVGGLGEVPSPALGRLLAALRRVCTWAEDRGLVPKARLEEMRGPPASRGHVCFRVVPDARSRTGARPSAVRR